MHRQSRSPDHFTPMVKAGLVTFYTTLALAFESSDALGIRKVDLCCHKQNFV